MRTAFYRDRWRDIRQRPAAAPEALKKLAQQVAYSFMDAHLKGGHYDQGYVRLLCEMATCGDRPLEGVAAQALFSVIIEGLCDEFEELQLDAYNRVMCQVVAHCRRLPPGRELDRRLTGFGITSEKGLLARVAAVRHNHRGGIRRAPIRKILLLSRVTIGADIAITSVVLQRLRRAFADAELVVIGDRRLWEIYGGHPGLRVEHVAYNRNGGLFERLATWQRVLDIVQAEHTASPPEATILVDPDSRLSQLGVLPLIDLKRYLFFASRSDGEFDRTLAMAELCNAWCDATLEEAHFCHPRVWPLPETREQARTIRRQLTSGGARKLITINFGVGGNPRKRVGRRLEEALLRTLLGDRKTVVLLDQGSGPNEARQARGLLKAVAAHGYPVAEADFNRGPIPVMERGVVALKTSVGEITALIAASDEYIGYDSAGQHIAAAAGTPCLTIFAGSNNSRFIRRWRAVGPNACRIVHVDTLNSPAGADIDDIITRVMNERHAMADPRPVPSAP
jgi:ADP-heptose:LPS heptosyltransferase